MSNPIKLPSNEQLSALSELAAHPKYRELAAKLKDAEINERLQIVEEVANVDWFDAAGLPLPDGAKVNPRLFEDPDRPINVSDLNALGDKIPTLLDPDNPLRPIVDPDQDPEIPIDLDGPLPDLLPDLEGNPNALTICGSIGGGVIVTVCGSVGT